MRHDCWLTKFPTQPKIVTLQNITLSGCPITVNSEAVIAPSRELAAMPKTLFLWMMVGAVLPAALRQTPVTPAELEGAWRLVQARTIAPDGSMNPYSTHESLLLFAGDFYSMGWASGAERAPFYDQRFRPSDEEKLARYSGLLVNAGRWQMDDGRLIIHPEFALVPEFVGGRGAFEVSLSGDTLELHWTVIRSADGVEDPMTAQGYSWKYTFERIR